jgi:hypothetical protein
VPLRVRGFPESDSQREDGTDRLSTTLNPYFCSATRER